MGARIYYDLMLSYDLVGTYYNTPLSKSFAKLDLTDRRAVFDCFNKFSPDVVVHAANYPSQKYVHGNEGNFRALNLTATNTIVESVHATGAKIVFISSQNANNPSGSYGMFKKESEEMIKSVSAGYLILRPSLILGMSPNMKNPRTFNKMLSCIEDPSKTAEFDTSWKLQPTYIGHLSRIIETVIRNNDWNRTVPVFINELVTQYQIAKGLLTPYGVQVNSVDQNVHFPPSLDNLDYVTSLHLTPETYSELVQVLIDEIRRKDQFKLP